MNDLFWSPQAVIFWQQLVNGATIGGIYALVALGYTMVYGIVRLINFPHGDLFSLGAFVALLVIQMVGSSSGGAPMLVAILLGAIFALVTVGLLGVCVERYAYRPLRERGSPRLTLLITAIGISFVVQNGIMLTWGPNYRIYPELDLAHHAWALGPARVTALQVVVFASALGLMAALSAFVNRTRLGKAMRAVSGDHDTARLMGINVNRVILLTFFLGSALGAASGIMVGLYYRQINFSMGYVYGLKAFTAAVMGGIGNIPGAMLGGFLLGILEALGAGYFAAEWKDVIAFGILIAVLVFKPTGILGRRAVEKV